MVELLLSSLVKKQGAVQALEGSFVLWPFHRVLQRAREQRTTDSTCIRELRQSTSKAQDRSLLMGTHQSLQLDMAARANDKSAT